MKTQGNRQIPGVGFREEVFAQSQTRKPEIIMKTAIFMYSIRFIQGPEAALDAKGGGC
jgi:hypothetical protein